ncbi:uncharacterized protein [Penaeus vannamei]|uniref:uncharacterized protein n=1 Tax=Penaeus vannamei TaxID=6689 RepID=UPI00387F5710
MMTTPVAKRLTQLRVAMVTVTLILLVVAAMQLYILAHVTQQRPRNERNCFTLEASNINNLADSAPTPAHAARPRDKRQTHPETYRTSPAETSPRPDTETSVKERSLRSDSEISIKKRSPHPDTETSIKERSQRSDTETSIKKRSLYPDTETSIKERSLRSDTETSIKERSPRPDTEIPFKEKSLRSDTETSTRKRSHRSDTKTSIKKRSLYPDTETSIQKRSHRSDTEIPNKEKSPLETSTKETLPNENYFPPTPLGWFLNLNRRYREWLWNRVLKNLFLF